MTELQKAVLCDPQTSGGLLIAVKPEAEQQVVALAAEEDIQLIEVGQLLAVDDESNVLIQVI